eukprot:3331325-Rhodomonas_salina.2
MQTTRLLAVFTLRQQCRPTLLASSTVRDPGSRHRVHESVTAHSLILVVDCGKLERATGGGLWEVAKCGLGSHAQRVHTHT